MSLKKEDIIICMANLINLLGALLKLPQDLPIILGIEVIIVILYMCLRKRERLLSWLILFGAVGMCLYTAPVISICSFILLSEYYRGKNSIYITIFSLISIIVYLATYSNIEVKILYIGVVFTRCLADIISIRGKNHYFSDSIQQLLSSESMEESIRAFGKLVNYYYSNNVFIVVQYKTAINYFRVEKGQAYTTNYDVVFQEQESITLPLNSNLYATNMVEVFVPKTLNRECLEMINIASQILVAIIERIMHTKEVQNNLYLDELTKVPNRKCLKKYLDNLSGPTAIAQFDLDKFKNVNDQFGHDVGDKVLIAFSSRVSKMLYKNELFGRWGGEEFLLIIQNTDDEEYIEQRLNVIREAVEEINAQQLGVEGRNITVSIGASVFYRRDWQKAYKEADEALYMAKITRNTVKLYS